MVWSLTLLYLTLRQVSWLKDPHTQPPSQSETSDVNGCPLPYHSDEIVRDSHPLPFYPPASGKALWRHRSSIQFTGLS